MCPLFLSDVLSRAILRHFRDFLFRAPHKRGLLRDLTGVIEAARSSLRGLALLLASLGELAALGAVVALAGIAGVERHHGVVPSLCDPNDLGCGSLRGFVSTLGLTYSLLEHDILLPIPVENGDRVHRLEILNRDTNVYAVNVKAHDVRHHFLYLYSTIKRCHPT